MAGRRFGARPTQELDMVSATVAPSVTDDAAAGYGVGSYWIDTTHDTVYQCVDSTNGAAVWKELDTTSAVHNVLSATHGDSTAHAAVRGDIITAQGASPVWAELVISVPAANVLNVLGVANGDVEPGWKTVLDATAPTTIGVHDTAAAGTSLVFAHRDHVHGSPTTYTATAHDILSTVHGDTLAAAVADGSIIIGNVTPKWSTLAISIPGGAALLNVLGVVTGETRPSWKALFDATNPADIAANATAGPGTSTVAAHCDHVHSLHTLGDYTTSNVSADRTFDADSTTIDELADILGTLIADLTTGGLLN